MSDAADVGLNAPAPRPNNTASKEATPPKEAPPASDEPTRPIEPAGLVPAPPARRKRRLWVAVALAVLIIAVFAGAAAGYSLRQPTVYGAQVEFVLTPRPELSDAAIDRAMVTQTMIITSDRVLAPVATQSEMTMGDLRAAVSAEIVGRSNILRLTVGDRSRSRAVTIVDLITAEYLRAVAGDAPADDKPRTIEATVLSPGAPLDEPLEPQPLRAAAAGVIVGLLVAAAAVTLYIRPRLLFRPPSRWG